MEERYYDKKGVPIYPGDLLRTYHFTGARRKVHYLYHVVVDSGLKALQMVPTSHLEPTKRCHGGCAYLKHMNTNTQSEVISGHGPGDILSFEERPKKK